MKEYSVLKLFNLISSHLLQQLLIYASYVKIMRYSRTVNLWTRCNNITINYVCHAFALIISLVIIVSFNSGIFYISCMEFEKACEKYAV